MTSVHVKEKGKNGLKEVWRGNTWLFWFWREREREGPAGVGEERGGRKGRAGAVIVWGGIGGEGDEERCGPVLLKSGVFHLICLSGSGCDSLVATMLRFKNGFLCV